MRPEVHAAALRSAAKLVLGMASLATLNIACSSETAEGETASNDSAVTTTEKAACAEPKKPAEPTACGAVLHAAFPDPSGYAWEPVKQSAEIVSCCKAELIEHDAMTPFRWDCCVAFDAAAQEDPDTEFPTTVAHTPGIGTACTPWGPPVPPSMKRKTRRSPARRDMAAFLAQAIV